MTSNQIRNKTILVVRDAGEKEVKVATATGENVKNIREDLKSFLLKNLGITDFKKHLVHGEHNGTVKSYIIKTDDDNGFSRVCSLMDSYSPRDRGGESEINDIDDSDFIGFIYSLIREGNLSFPINKMDYKEEVLSKMPMILLAEMSLNEESNNYHIKSFATNDKLMIDLDTYDSGKDKHKEHSYSNDIHADDAINRMIRHGMIDHDNRHQKQENANEGLGKTINFKKEEGRAYQSFIKNTDEINIIKNSLLLSDVFLETFAKESGRDFGFDQRMMTSIGGSLITRWGFLPKYENTNKYLHSVIRSIDLKKTRTALLEMVTDIEGEMDNNASLLLVSALNDFFFNRAYKGVFTDKKGLITTDGSKIIPIDTDTKENSNYAYGTVNLGRIIACIADKNEAGEVLEMTLCEANSKFAAGEYNDEYLEKTQQSYSLTLSNNANGKFEIERIHKSQKVGVLVNKVFCMLENRHADSKQSVEMHDFMPLLRHCFAIHGNEKMLEVNIEEL
ncbi:MAG: hypothetical protein J6N72_09465 [Psychrobacter sp.]|nr:hypothetical protein [Psychrobacter sp.]